MFSVSLPKSAVPVPYASLQQSASSVIRMISNNKDDMRYAPWDRVTVIELDRSISHLECRGGIEA